MSRTILLVEDNPDDVFFVKHAMNRAGMNIRVQVAKDGQQAIDYLRGIGEYRDRVNCPLPCLVLLDLKLPLVMGLEVLKWIREQPGLNGVAVLILTSSALKKDITTAYSLGANSFFVKPTSPQLLTEMLKSIKKYWLELNEFDTETEAVIPQRAYSNVGSYQLYSLEEPRNSA